MKTIYFCNVTRKDGSKFTNPLLPSEIHLVGTLARENREVNVTHMEVDETQFKHYFG